MNIQVYYPWKFSFVPSHYYAAFIFLAALALHVTLKIPTIRKAYRERGVVAPLHDDLEHTVPEPYDEGTTTALEPAAPTISRRGLLLTVGAASAGIGLMMSGQVIGGPLRKIALLAPRGTQPGSGPNGFQINKTAVTAGIDPKQTGADWRLKLVGVTNAEFSRDELLAMPQHTYDLPIACVEGWTTTQSYCPPAACAAAAACACAAAAAVASELPSAPVAPAAAAGAAVESPEVIGCCGSWTPFGASTVLDPGRAGLIWKTLAGQTRGFAGSPAPAL